MEIQSNETDAGKAQDVVAQPSIFKEVKHWEVDYSDLDTLIQEKLGVPDFEFVIAEECGNDTQHSQTAEIVTDSFWLNVHKETLEDVKKGDWVNTTSTLLNELAMQKIILPGNYLIFVSW